ncbi:hypothetical protein MLD38_013531 [Melastoma candidum]|uniref:Uncharacterized protein n=1 Tax=Melastoma candidum TaxID=119954 RepID=A0ACB9R9A0_9MYRT|nr:hypothetical protein MLD38_013531 [Melastoma candidum]
MVFTVILSEIKCLFLAWTPESRSRSPERPRCFYVGVDDDHQLTEDVDDGLGDIWNEMTMALECAKDVIEDPVDSAEDYSSDESLSEEIEGCNHSILKDDIGYVCRVCGVIDRKIENIFEFQYHKRTRTYMSESRNHKNRDSAGIDGLDMSRDLEISDISAHPRQMKQMKPHQVEGSIFCFMQSFLAKYPDAKALVVLPKSILPTWKKEFQTWQVEDIPLLDFYTAKADSRVQQLEILKQWMAQKSILFLGYRHLQHRYYPDSEEGGPFRNPLSKSCQGCTYRDFGGKPNRVRTGFSTNWWSRRCRMTQMRNAGRLIQDLREMTRDILHYYKGDFLDELQGLVDLTVVLNHSKKQRDEVQKLRRRPVRKFELGAEGSSIYLHPRLNTFSKISTTTDAMMDELVETLDVRQGAKAKFFMNLLNLCISAGEKLLVFSQYLIPPKFLERLVVKMKNWSLGKELFIISGDTNTDNREWAMKRFNNSPDAKILFGSIRACGEGISLVGASRIEILVVPLNPSVTRQAIGRAFRPGQKRKVYAYRLVAADSPEEDDHDMCYEKELISKMWLEWNEYSGFRDFKIENVDVKECGDKFLETPILAEDVKALYKW